MWPDLINGGFELIGAFFTWRNWLQLRRDRTIAGVYWPTTAFFAAWGIWNLVYYPALNQWASFAGGVVLVAGNVAWVALAIKIKLNATLDAPFIFSVETRKAIEDACLANQRLTDAIDSRRSRTPMAEHATAAQVVRHGMLDCQVCVPKDWDDEQVKAFTDAAFPCGTENGWHIRGHGDQALDGDPDRVPCAHRHGFVHLMLDA